MAAFTELVDLAAGRLGGQPCSRATSSSRRRRICSSRRSRSGVPTDIPTAASGWTAGSRAAGARRGADCVSSASAFQASSAASSSTRASLQGTSHRTVRSTAASLRRIPALRRSRQSRRRGARCSPQSSCGRQRELLRRRRRAPFHARAAEHFPGRRRQRGAGPRLGGHPGRCARRQRFSDRARRARHRLQRSGSTAIRRICSMPYRAANMGDGWETRRRRGPGHDWAILGSASRR